MEVLKIVKIGGNVVDDPSLIREVLFHFNRIPSKKILVHGGGKQASDLAKRLGITTKMIDGRRITDAQSLQVVQMVYAGLINTTIVARLQALKVNAIGLTGADGDAIFSEKRPVDQIDYGFVGDVRAVNTRFLQSLLVQNLVPVFCALTHDGKGQILNTNADTVATEIAVALSRVYRTELIFTFDRQGVLKDVNDEQSVIPHLTRQTYQRFKKEKVISDGMLPKLDNAFRSLQNGVNMVRILHARDLEKLNAGRAAGTKITLE